MDWDKLLRSWGPLSGVLIVAFWVFVYALQLRDDWKEMRGFMCSRAIISLLAMEKSIDIGIKEDISSLPEPQQFIITEIQAGIEWELQKLEAYCLRK